MSTRACLRCALAPSVRSQTPTRRPAAGRYFSPFLSFELLFCLVFWWASLSSFGCGGSRLLLLSAFLPLADLVIAGILVSKFGWLLGKGWNFTCGICWTDLPASSSAPFVSISLFVFALTDSLILVYPLAGLGSSLFEWFTTQVGQYLCDSFTLWLIKTYVFPFIQIINVSSIRQIWLEIISSNH